MPWTRFNLPDEALKIVSAAPSLTLARNVDDLVELAVRDVRDGWHEVGYDVADKGTIVEARVSRTRNGIAANYLEPSWTPHHRPLPGPCLDGDVRRNDPRRCHRILSPNTSSH